MLYVKKNIIQNPFVTLLGHRVSNRLQQYNSGISFFVNFGRAIYEFSMNLDVFSKKPMKYCGYSSKIRVGYGPKPFYVITMLHNDHATVRPC